jgi:GNAT superfamily N-acetyltransferase
MDAHPNTIRVATPPDAEQIADIHVQAWRWAYRGKVPDTFLASLSVSDRVDTWRATLDEPDSSRVWVAEAGGDIVGFASAGACRDEDVDPATGEVYAIYIEPSRVGSGLGRGLFETATSWLRPRFQCATLWVLASNSRARRFYEKAGWAPDGSTKVDPREGFSLNEVRYRIVFEADIAS